MNTDIEQAIESLRANQTRYDKTERYHRGEHNLMFATEKFQNTFGSLFREFAMNLCPAICDAVKDKLKITEFRVESGTSALGSRAERIWQKNRMATRAGEVHKEALKNGDAYAIVWPDADGEPIIYPNKAASITVVYDEDSPGQILWAAKFWRTNDKRTRLNIFYPDRIERYTAVKENGRLLPDAKEFVSFAEAVIQLNPENEPVQISTIDNPYGVVPVFHFANNADLGMPGQSELLSAIPVQDGLNKSVLDMLVAMEFSAYRQRWAAGIEIEYDNEGKAAAPFTAGIDHLWIAQNPNARFGDFESANLDHFLRVKDSFRIDMASVTGTPLHYLMPHTNRSKSGESLKKAETRFIAKVRDRQESFGQTWADLMACALKVEGHGDGIRLITAWEDADRMSEREFLENIILKQQIGITPEQALTEAGYGGADVVEMLEKR